MNESEFDDIIQKYREETITSSLVFVPPLHKLLDAKHCRSLSDLLRSSGKWERAIAVSDLHTQLPEERGVYMFVWCPEIIIEFESNKKQRLHWILYVGKAGKPEEGTHDNLRSRYRCEYSSYVGKDPSPLWTSKNDPQNRSQLLARFLTIRPLEYWYLCIKNAQDIELIERKLIKLLQPPLNRHHGPRLRAGKPIKIEEQK